MSFSHILNHHFSGFFCWTSAIPSKPSGRLRPSGRLTKLGSSTLDLRPERLQHVRRRGGRQRGGPTTADPDGRHPKKPVGNYGLFFRDFCEGSWVISYIIHEWHRLFLGGRIYNHPLKPAISWRGGCIQIPLDLHKESFEKNTRETGWLDLQTKGWDCWWFRNPHLGCIKPSIRILWPLQWRGEWTFWSSNSTQRFLKIFTPTYLGVLGNPIWLDSYFAHGLVNKTPPRFYFWPFL